RRARTRAGGTLHGLLAERAVAAAASARAVCGLRAVAAAVAERGATPEPARLLAAQARRPVDAEPSPGPPAPPAADVPGRDAPLPDRRRRGGARARAGSPREGHAFHGVDDGVPG